MVHSQKDVKNATHSFNFRETSSMLFSNSTLVDDYFTNKTVAEVRPEKAIAVPGLVKGLYELHREHGRYVESIGISNDKNRQGVFYYVKRKVNCTSNNIFFFMDHFQGFLKKIYIFSRPL